MKYLCFCLIVWQSGMLSAQAVPPDTIPFTFTEYNNISIRATLNGLDTLDLMFHTAVNVVSLTSEAVQGLRGFNIDDSTSVYTWGGESSAKYSKHHRLQIGNFEWEDLTIWESRHSGKLTDGKFGPNLFEGRVLEINFDHNILILHTDLPDIEAGFEQLNLINEDGLLFLEGELGLDNQLFENRFLIHSGYSGSVLLDDEFVSKHKRLEILPVLKETELKDSHGNVLITKKVKISSLAFGASVFSDVPVGFFSGAIGRQKMSVLGGDVLKRFNLLFDAENKYIYMRPNTLADVAYLDV